MQLTQAFQNLSTGFSIEPQRLAVRRCDTTALNNETTDSPIPVHLRRSNRSHGLLGLGLVVLGTGILVIGVLAIAGISLLALVENVPRLVEKWHVLSSMI